MLKSIFRQQFTIFLAAATIITFSVIYGLVRLTIPLSFFASQSLIAALAVAGASLVVLADLYLTPEKKEKAAVKTGVKEEKILPQVFPEEPAPEIEVPKSPEIEKVSQVTEAEAPPRVEPSEVKRPPISEVPKLEVESEEKKIKEEKSLQELLAEGYDFLDEEKHAQALRNFQLALDQCKKEDLAIQIQWEIAGVYQALGENNKAIVELEKAKMKAQQIKALDIVDQIQELLQLLIKEV